MQFLNWELTKENETTTDYRGHDPGNKGLNVFIYGDYGLS